MSVNKTMRRTLTILIIVVSNFCFIYSADSVSVHNNHLLHYKIVNNDTVLYSDIREVKIYSMPKFKNNFEYWKYKRLVKNVKKAYPYALLANRKLNEVNNIMLTMRTEKEQKDYMKQVEKEIRDEFEDELKGLTITQGRILIKLIDRETGSTSYDLVKELRGNFSAIFWQTLARIFGSNLKTEFDAEGDDKLIDQIVVLIENGQL